MHNEAVTKLRNHLKQVAGVANADLDMALQHISIRHFVKGETLLHIGEHCAFIGFVHQGLLVSLSIDEGGNENVVNFIQESCFFTHTEGLLQDIPSDKQFTALEDLVVVWLEKKMLASILNTSPALAHALTNTLLADIQLLMQRQHSLRKKSAEERYLEFVLQQPVLYQRVPMKYLASYLGIEPQSLSRLRAKIAKEKK